MPRPRRSDLELAHSAAKVWADPEREQTIAYVNRAFALTSLPYQNPGPETKVWYRRNGDFLLKITPGVADAAGTSIGFPYGTIPRLLVAYLTTEVMKTKEPKILLPDSMAQFMGELGMKSTGGKNGTIARLRNQADRLFESTFTTRWERDDQRDMGRKFVIASEWDLNWNPKSGVESFVRVSSEFFNEIRRGAVPFDLDAFLSLGGSALRMDLYVWLTYRMKDLHHPYTIPFQDLQGQFGFQLADDAKGRSKFKSILAKNLPYVTSIYRDANVEVTKTGLKLYPSRTHVPFRGLGRQLKLLDPVAS